MPGVLTDVCHVAEELATRVGEDILTRAESYAALEGTARNVLISPFAEEVAGYEPPDSSLELKGAVAVVVRSSLLEEAHSHGPVEAGGIKGITTMAAAPLSHFLAARRRSPVTVSATCSRTWQTPSHGPGHASAPWPWPMAPAVAGGRTALRPRRSRNCPLPRSRRPEQITARTRSSSAASTPGLTSCSCSTCGRGPRMVTRCWLTASLSRISRHLGKLLRAMEYLLAHDVPILTGQLSAAPS